MKGKVLAEEKLIEYKERVFKNLWILWEIHIKNKIQQEGEMRK